MGRAVGHWLFPALLALLLCVSVQAAEYYAATALELQTTLSGSFTATLASNGRLDAVDANLSFFPIPTPTQDILDETYTPRPVQFDPLTFRWERPAVDDLTFRLSHTMRVRQNFPEIRYRIPYPLPYPTTALPLEVQPYLTVQQIIDADPAITALAQQLAEGQDDLTALVHTFAVWVRENIAYNLTTANVEASERASTVLRTRNGVCDELTSLFIALLRSIGIPARFVSGIAYTNSPLFERPWGPHGWAEVYFPGVGWVPYDITYDEFGWVDATHIVAGYTADAGQISLDYAWRGDAELSANPLEIAVAVHVVGAARESPIRLALVPVQEEVGFGSANRLVATVENLQEFTIAVPLTISRTTQLAVSSKPTQFALLPPKAVQQISWLVQVPADLERGYSYTYPVSVTAFGINASASFTASAHAPQISASQLPPLQTLPYAESLSGDSAIDFHCTLPKVVFRKQDRVVAYCTLRNNGELREVSLCWRAECEQLRLGSGQEKLVELPLRSAFPGEYHETAVARTGDVLLHAPLSFTVLDDPHLSVSDAAAPVTLSFNDAGVVQFTLRKSSVANAYNVTVRISLPGFTQEFRVPIFDADRQFTVPIAGSDLDVGENAVPITVQWVDQDGATQDGSDGEFHSSETLPITLSPPTAFQRFLLLLRDGERWVANLFTRNERSSR